VGSESNSLGLLLGPLTLAGQGGIDRLTVNDQGTATGQVYTLSPNGILTRSGAAPVTFTAISVVSFHLGLGSNQLGLVIPGPPRPPPNSPRWEVYLGPGDDGVQILGSFGNLNLLLDGGLGNNSLELSPLNSTVWFTGMNAGDIPNVVAAPGTGLVSFTA